MSLGNVHAMVDSPRRCPRYEIRDKNLAVQISPAEGASSQSVEVAFPGGSSNGVWAFARSELRPSVFFEQFLSMRYVRLTFLVLLIVATERAQAQPSEFSSANFVSAGRIESARVGEGKWERVDGYIVSTGRHYLYAGRGLGAGDFTITATVSLEKLEMTAAALVLDGNQFAPTRLPRRFRLDRTLSRLAQFVA